MPPELRAKRVVGTLKASKQPSPGNDLSGIPLMTGLEHIKHATRQHTLSHTFMPKGFNRISKCTHHCDNLFTVSFDYTWFPALFCAIDYSCYSFLYILLIFCSIIITILISNY